MEHSPLGRLPPELRNIIYYDVLTSKGPIVSAIRNIRGARRAARRDRDIVLGKSLGLLLTCRVIYSEALPVFYGANDFQLLAQPHSAPKALRSLTRNTTTKRNLQMLKHLTLNLGHLFGQSDTVNDFEGIVDAVKAYSGKYAECDVSVVFTTYAPPTLPTLRFELKPRPYEAMTISAPRCLKQIAKTISNGKASTMQGSPSALAWVEAEEYVSRAEDMLKRLMATYGGRLLDD